MKLYKISIKLISGLVFISSIGLLIALTWKPQWITQFSLIDRFISSLKIKANSSEPNPSVQYYNSKIELEILENIRKDSDFERVCISQIRCNFKFSFSSDIPFPVQNRIKQLIRKNYRESQGKLRESQNLLLKFEIFTSKKDPYLQPPKGTIADSEITEIEELFSNYQNNESLLFQIDYYNQANKIKEIAFTVKPEQNDFKQKKTR